MRNPHSLRANAPFNSFELAVLNPDGYLIEQVTEGVVAKPLLRGMLLKDVLVSR